VQHDDEEDRMTPISADADRRATLGGQAEQLQPLRDYLGGEAPPEL
jgi:hypothetical protein